MTQLETIAIEVLSEKIQDALDSVKLNPEPKHVHELTVKLVKCKSLADAIRNNKAEILELHENM